MNKYDEQIERLTKDPHLIANEWCSGIGLFKFVEDPNSEYSLGEPIKTGCLTLIRLEPFKYKAVIKGKVDEKLTLEIANDERLPIKNFNITVTHLIVFKEWQERIDKLQNT